MKALFNGLFLVRIELRNKSFSRSGFTLSEVLITLLIIGVVASLTIPSIINDTMEAEYSTALKKAYSDLSQALKITVANNGGTIYTGTGPLGGLARAEFCNVMKCIKSDELKNIFYKDYNGYKAGSSGWPAMDGGSAATILSNGQFLGFYTFNNCNNTGVNSCGEILIDINGMKSPNMWGKDLYGFHITLKNGSYSLLPVGIAGDGSNCAQYSWEDCTFLRLTDPSKLP